MAMSQTRRLRGALFLALCVFSLWNFSVSTAFTTTEEVTESPSAGVTFIADHPLLFSFIVMALCGGLCMTENSSTPRQGNAEDRADYSSFSALTEGLHRCIQNGITRRCLSLPICTTHFTGYLTDVGTGLGLWARETVLLFAAGLLFFGLGGVAAKELHGPFNMQGALLAAGLMGAVSAGLVPVVKVKKAA
eukprot:symbB.v1.2.021287.t1/scaffold1833.1/size99481/5